MCLCVCVYAKAVHVDLSFTTLTTASLVLLLLVLLLLLELLVAGLLAVVGLVTADIPLARIMLGLGRTPSGCRGPTGVDSIGSAACS